jgi:hypothetical protein
MANWFAYAIACNIGLFFITFPQARKWPLLATFAYLPTFLTSAFIPPKWYNQFLLNVSIAGLRPPSKMT